MRTSRCPRKRWSNSVRLPPRRDSPACWWPANADRRTTPRNEDAVRIGKIEVKRRVWVGLGCGLAATAAWWGWTRSEPLVVAARPAAPQPFVRLVGTGNDRSEQIL